MLLNFDLCTVRLAPDLPEHAYCLSQSVSLHSIHPSSGSLRGVKWFKTDVAGLPIGRIFNGHDVAHQDGADTTCPETSVSNNLTTRNNPEDGRIQFNCVASTCIICVSRSCCLQPLCSPFKNKSKVYSNRLRCN